MSGTPNEILATIWRSMTILTGTIYIIVLWHITTNKTGQKYQYKNNIHYTDQTLENAGSKKKIFYRMVGNLKECFLVFDQIKL